MKRMGREGERVVQPKRCSLIYFLWNGRRRTREKAHTTISLFSKPSPPLSLSLSLVYSQALTKVFPLACLQRSHQGLRPAFLHPPLPSPPCFCSVRASRRLYLICTPSSSFSLLPISLWRVILLQFAYFYSITQPFLSSYRSHAAHILQLSWIFISSVAFVSILLQLSN